MKSRPPLSLPVVRQREVPGGAVGHDQARIEAGWTFRFVAGGARAEEMIQLYRELGFDVETDDVSTDPDPRLCTVCYSESPSPYRAIYTRLRRDSRDDTSVSQEVAGVARPATPKQE